MTVLPITNQAQTFDVLRAEYTSLYKKQEQLLDKRGEFLKTVLSWFYTSRGSRIDNTYSTSTDDTLIDHLWQNSVYVNVHDVDHAAMILNAVLHLVYFSSFPADARIPLNQALNQSKYRVLPIKHPHRTMKSRRRRRPRPRQSDYFDLPAAAARLQVGHD